MVDASNTLIEDDGDVLASPLLLLVEYMIGFAKDEFTTKTGVVCNISIALVDNAIKDDVTIILTWVEYLIVLIFCRLSTNDVIAREGRDKLDSITGSALIEKASLCSAFDIESILLTSTVEKEKKSKLFHFLINQYLPSHTRFNVLIT